MKITDHSRGPFAWAASGPDQKIVNVFAYTKNGSEIIATLEGATPKLDAHRIVECLTACEGLEDPVAIRSAYTIFTELKEWAQQVEMEPCACHDLTRQGPVVFSSCDGCVGRSVNRVLALIQRV